MISPYQSILGNLTGVKAPSGELRFERDPLGRVVREAQIVGTKEHWTEVAYDAAGDRGPEQSMTYFVAASRVTTRAGMVYHYSRSNLKPGKRIAEWVMNQPSA